jgi:hypothetical protein
MPSPNYSSRGGSAVRLIVVHTAEGARTIEELGNFFASSSSGVSSHTGADDKKRVIAEYVRRPDKAWTQGNANPVAVSMELCAFASWSRDEWMRHPNMLENCALWVAEEADYFGLPLSALTDSQAQGSGRGVCQHENLGSWGGGHWDCGGGFPMDYVLDMAKGGAAPAPPVKRKPRVYLGAFGGGEEMALYLIHDVTGDRDRWYAAFDSGLMRQVPGPEKDWLKKQGLEVFTVDSQSASDRFEDYDKALRA